MLCKGYTNGVSVKLNDSLNLVVPIGDKKAFHTPISREVFEANYRLLASTRAHLASEGIYYQMDAGPRIAAMILRDKARRDFETWGEGDDKPRDVLANALFNEIKRLTTILAPTANGWESLPVDSAIQSGVIDSEEWDEALSQIVFFTCHYAMGKKAERPRIAGVTASLLASSITPSSLSEYASSLPKLTQPGPSPKAGLSVPS